MLNVRRKTSSSQAAAAGLRVTGDYRRAKISAKIRDAQLELDPLHARRRPQGQREQAASPSATASTATSGFMTLATAIAKLKAEAEGRQIRQTVMKSSAASVASSDSAGGQRVLSSF